MKIETFKINLAVADGVDRKVASHVVVDAVSLIDKTIGIFGVEVEELAEGRRNEMPYEEGGNDGNE